MPTSAPPAGTHRRAPLRECSGSVRRLLLATDAAYSTASGCYRESATLAIEVGDFKGALERWEQVAAMALESNLTRYSVKDYYLAAGGCYLAIPVSVACSV